MSRKVGYQGINELKIAEEQASQIILDAKNSIK